MFYGRQLNMARQEILVTRVGEMLDMISCLAIYNGTARPKRKRRKLSYQEIMKLR